MTAPSRRPTAPAPSSSITAGYEKRLMITAGRASRELGGGSRRSSTWS